MMLEAGRRLGTPLVGLENVCAGRQSAVQRKEKGALVQGEGDLGLHAGEGRRIRAIGVRKGAMLLQHDQKRRDLAVRQPPVVRRIQEVSMEPRRGGPLRPEGDGSHQVLPAADEHGNDVVRIRREQLRGRLPPIGPFGQQVGEPGPKRGLLGRAPVVERQGDPCRSWPDVEAEPSVEDVQPSCGHRVRRDVQIEDHGGVGSAG